MIVPPQVMKDCFKQLKSVEESVKTKKDVSENGGGQEGTEDADEEEEDEADGTFVVCLAVIHRNTTSFHLMYPSILQIQVAFEIKIFRITNGGT